MFKKVKKINFLFLVSVLFSASLTSCQAEVNNDVYFNFGVNGAVNDYYDIYKEKEDADPMTSIVDAFGTVLSGKVYEYKANSNEKVSEAELNKLKFDFNNTIMKYHTLFDRHYYYAEKNDETKTFINNLKILNDNVGSNAYIEVDPILFDAIKMAYEFTKISENKFSLFIANLSDIYEDLIPNTKGNNLYNHRDKSVNDLLAPHNYFYIGSLPSQDELNKALVCTPNNQELQNETLIEFNEENHSIKINNTQRCQNANGKIQLSLSGMGKGLAVEEFVDNFQEYTLLINGGSSSIKTQNSKKSRTWNVSLTNPKSKEMPFNYTVENERLINYYNNYEVMIKFPSTFNLSTSGYYEQYYYVPLEKKETSPTSDTSRELPGIFTNEENLVEFNLGYNIQESEPLENDPTSVSNERLYDIKDFFRVNHIINAETGLSSQTFDFVSVDIQNSALADMYTTALMNTNSEQEAIQLKKKLDQYYNQNEDSLMILSYKQFNDPNNFHIEVPMLILNPKYDPDATDPNSSAYKNPRITSIGNNYYYGQNNEFKQLYLIYGNRKNYTFEIKTEGEVNNDLPKHNRISEIIYK